MHINPAAISTCKYCFRFNVSSKISSWANNLAALHNVATILPNDSLDRFLTFAF